MAWTEAQCVSLFEGFWRTASGECPTCNAQVHFTVQPYHGGYSLMGSCPNACGQLTMGPQNDPLYPTFRQWTADEASGIFNTHFAGQVPPCPLDKAPVEVKVNTTTTGIEATAFCRRCGQGWKDVFAKP
jgi:hypothetical protein